jgi:DNA-binding FadR family transcriptional regulator
MTANSQSLTQQIVDVLGQAIVKGDYSGEKAFPIEAELCEQFEVSRSVLREAVKMLTSKGLLRARPRQGTWVLPEQSWNLLDPDVLRWLLNRKFSIELLSEFTEVRLAIEPEAAALAAVRASASEKQAIKTALERMQAAEVGDDDPLLSDIAFHVAVLNASGNRFYAQLRGMVETALRISIRLTNQYKGVALASVSEHQKVYDAIEKGDANGARLISQKLVQEASDLIARAKGRKP